MRNSLFPPDTPPDPSSSDVHYTLVAVCLQLTLSCAVSFRAVPKIMAVFQQFLQLFGVTKTIHLPHFTTVIRWTLRVGIFLLTRSVTHRLSSWVCIIDHTIQVGTKKAFVVLKAPVDALKSPGALTLNDVAVLSITVRDRWNGEAVHEVLHALFSTVGAPIQVVADGGPDLQKGLRLLRETSKYSCKVTADITHLVANLLKRKYQHHTTFTSLMTQLARTKQTIQQTSLAYLAPLKERSKARFLNLPSIAKWTKQIIEYMHSFPPLPPEKPEEEYTAEEHHQHQIQTHLGWLGDYLPFLHQFWTEIQDLSEVQKSLKTTKLTTNTLHNVTTVIQRLHDIDIQKALLDYLKNECEHAMQTSHPLLLSSDIIESLFGKYKYLAKPHSLSEINRTIFAVPCLCEEITPELVKDAFSSLSHAEMEQRIHQDISETLLSKRRKAFSSSPNAGNIPPLALPSSHEETLEDYMLMEYHGPETEGTPSTGTG
jgi:hypothetical protein